MIPFVIINHKSDNLNNYLHTGITYKLNYNNAVTEFKDCNMSANVTYEGLDNGKLIFRQVENTEESKGGLGISTIYKIPLRHIHNFTLYVVDTKLYTDFYGESFKSINIFSKIKFQTYCQINPDIIYNHFYRIYGNVEELLGIGVFTEITHNTTFTGEICTIVKKGSGGTVIRFLRTDGLSSTLDCGYVVLQYLDNVELEEL